MLKQQQKIKHALETRTGPGQLTGCWQERAVLTREQDRRQDRTGQEVLEQGSGQYVPAGFGIIENL